jgi:DNA repair exonuclease SbcCD ATPase subunit
VTAEETEKPGGGQDAGGGAQPGGLGQHATPSGGLGRAAEGDLLAERRARRAAESGETALIRRAEAAEATVQTLEAHVASLQQRLREAEDERRRLADLLETREIREDDRRSPAEHDLRRAKQREYAEQQLRVEAEDRVADLERQSDTEIERLSRRLGASERGARELASQLERVQRELAEAEQSAATELASVRRAARDFQERLTDLERRALEIHTALLAERTARERSERRLENMRMGNRRVEGLVAELRALVARLRAAASVSVREQTVPVEDQRPSPPRTAPCGPGEADQGEMTDALAAAVERLRARVEDMGDAPEQSEYVVETPATQPQPTHAHPAAKPTAPAAKASRQVAGAQSHKHSASLLKRWRIRRKDRRSRRSAAAQPPSMQSK